MDDKTIMTGVLCDEHTIVSFIEVCERFHLSQHELDEMIEHGLFNQDTTVKNQLVMNTQVFHRIEAACRLQKDLGVNLQGVILVLELLDQLEGMRNELSILRRHLE